MSLIEKLYQLIRHLIKMAMIFMVDFRRLILSGIIRYSTIFYDAFLS